VLTEAEHSTLFRAALVFRVLREGNYSLPIPDFLLTTKELFYPQRHTRFDVFIQFMVNVGQFMASNYHL
jgi:hypothetical protein